ncbi:23S rRNA (guanosine(2251)-2'-O)-methyltransferase RlmB [Inconstantimicrobium mannanitabidum]|uniref:23S rRNA (Guanosine(2251)-2'-O)-methyltransferase RlmB n=1 Tax=Inconstantimicrobium mannanitabidum TaxID=1604901 RepID=A0ACB5RIA1_9CLOT|nr:23S rRNA (guanosine(2251)-2'-O)-methyltransferase RlmB [Clostridium sp. TW13]GKX68798.1 23S rRNA (guanosine(2251)-2'-O)-methyltransferase RlmB [Clostridium sp. TW13]
MKVDNKKGRFQKESKVCKSKEEFNNKKVFKDNRRRDENSTVKKADNFNEAVREDIIEGRNAVIEALKSDRTIEQIMIAKGDKEGSIIKLIQMAKDKGIVIKEVDRRKLDGISETGAHQGVIAIVTPFKYSTVEEILDFAKSRGESPFIVILDEIEDPHNLGSIVRTAELCGVHGIVIPKRRNVGITPTVYKTAAGAIEHMKIAKVTNINQTIDTLKKEGVWVYGADIEGTEYSYETDFSGPCCLIVGNEGTGMAKLTKDRCDKLIKIPMVGKINSLNASVAGGIMMYEVLRGRFR